MVSTTCYSRVSRDLADYDISAPVARVRACDAGARLRPESMRAARKHALDVRARLLVRGTNLIWAHRVTKKIRQRTFFRSKIHLSETVLKIFCARSPAVPRFFW